MRLKILVSKDVVEKWVRSFQKSVSSKDNVLVLVLDNCDFHIHVTHTRSDNRSSYIHVVNHFIVEITLVCCVMANSLWTEISNKAFGKWMKATPDESELFSQGC